MSPLHQARFQEAVEALDLLLGYAGGWMPVWREQQVGRPKVWWHHVGVLGSGRVLAELVQAADESYSDEITFGLPCRERWEVGPHDSTILWCRVEGKEQVERARKFHPRPTLVLQEGASSRRLLIWSLREPLDYFEAEKMNRRIAYRVGAVQKFAVPEDLRIPAPGTCLRVRRSRPVPIVVGRLTTVSFAAADVAGRLKDPPDVKWWERPIERRVP